MTTQTIDLTAHTSSLLARGVDVSMATRTTLDLVAKALEADAIAWTPHAHAQALLIDRADSSDVTIYWDTQDPDSTRADSSDVTIYWDTQDPDSTGWAYRVSLGGRDLESGVIDTLVDVLELAQGQVPAERT